MAQHRKIPRWHRQRDDTIQQMLQALPIPTAVISTRITMVADNPRTGLPHNIASMLRTEAGAIHWAMDQLNIRHLMILGSDIANTASWRYGYTDTGCRRLGYSVLAVSQAAHHMGWGSRDRWQKHYNRPATEIESLLYNVITELMANHTERAAETQRRLEQQARRRVDRLTQQACQRAREKVRQQQATRLAALERFKKQAPSEDSVNAVIADPVYRFTAGIANSQKQPEKTGTDK